MMWTNDGPNLYWDSEKQHLVHEGDSRAAWLLVAAGGQLPLEEAERYGLIAERKAAAAKAKQEVPANKLKQPPPQNKLKTPPPANKAKE